MFSLPHIACRLSPVASLQSQLATRLSTGVQCPLSSVRYKCFTWATAGDILIRFVTNILISYVRCNMRIQSCVAPIISTACHGDFSLYSQSSTDFKRPTAVANSYFSALINLYLKLLPYFKIKGIKGKSINLLLSCSYHREINQQNLSKTRNKHRKAKRENRRDY